MVADAKIPVIPRVTNCNDDNMLKLVIKIVKDIVRHSDV